MKTTKLKNTGMKRSLEFFNSELSFNSVEFEIGPERTGKKGAYVTLEAQIEGKKRRFYAGEGALIQIAEQTNKIQVPAENEVFELPEKLVLTWDGATFS